MVDLGEVNRKSLVYCTLSMPCEILISFALFLFFRLFFTSAAGIGTNCRHSGRPMIQHSRPAYHVVKNKLSSERSNKVRLKMTRL